MEQRIEGNKAGSVTVKSGGQVVGSKSKHGSNGVIATHNVDGDLPEIGFRSGRTIALARYEFCRLKIDLRVHIPEDLPKEEAQAAIQEMVLHLVHREEAHVAKQDYMEKLSVEAGETVGRCVRRYISIDYGLTLKRGGPNSFESEQVDVLQGVPVSDGADILAEFDRISEEMTAMLDQQFNRIKGADTGL